MRNLFYKYVAAPLVITTAMLSSCTDPIKQFEITEVWRTDTILQTPESVILDKKHDILYVTNMNLEPRKKDGNGFISKMDKTGKITELRWIEGLSSPKGMAIVGDTHDPEDTVSHLQRTLLFLYPVLFRQHQPCNRSCILLLHRNWQLKETEEQYNRISSGPIYLTSCSLIKFNEILFDLQSCCRIDSCCPICLETHREKCDQYSS